MLGNLQRQKAHHYFDLLDQDEDGYINSEDFEIQAEQLADERGLSEEKHDALREHMLSWWKQLCASADADDDKQVSRNEWETFWDAIVTSVEDGTEEEREQVMNSLEKAGRVTYRTIKTGDGEDASDDEETSDDGVTEEEYAEWLEAWGAEGSSMAFEELDRSDTGTLTEDDIVNAVKEFYLSDDFEDAGNLLYGSLQ